MAADRFRVSALLARQLRERGVSVEAVLRHGGGRRAGALVT